MPFVLASASCGRENVLPATESQADQFQDTETSELSGTYGWDPEGGFPNAVWSGTLVIDGPCVYLDVSHQDGIPVPEGEPLRSFVRLPEPLTRYGSATGEVWVGEHGPMSTGDDVVLVGSEGWQRHWNQPGEDSHVFESVWSTQERRSTPVCAAHVSFYAASMSPSGSNGGETTLDITRSTHLSGLFPWDTDQAHHDVAVDMVLILEPPCVYAASPADPDAPDVDSRAAKRYFLRLPRPLVRFDSGSNSLWVDDYGPMTTGDRVSLNATSRESTYGSELYEGHCLARGEMHSPWMHPASDPDELVGMRTYTDWGAGPAVGYEGVLFIEYPCAYLYPRDNKELLYPSENTEIPDLGASVAPSGERALLLLVRDWTDYDPETNTLRFRELHYVADTDSYMIGAEGSGEGPIASGDQVDLAGVSRPIQEHEDVCQRDFDIHADRISLCGLHVCQMEREARRHADTSP